MRQPPTAKVRDQMAAKAEALFARSIEPLVRDRAATDYLLIDVNSGDFEVDADEMAAARRLRDRQPQALVWMRRVGSPHGRRVGGHRTRSQP